MVAASLIFASPSWFAAIPLIGLAAIGLWFLARRLSRQRIERFASLSCLPEEVVIQARKLRLRRFCVVGVTAMLFAVALARPLTGPKEENDQRKGADLVIALDVSKSMWVTDVAPNRLAAVKESLGQWVQNQKVDRIGLVLFAGDAFVQAPLTYDYTALNFVLQDASPASVSKKGTNIPKAIETAAQMMRNNEVESKFLLLVSDGENIEGDAITAAREAYQNEEMRIYTVGVGTSGGGKVQSYDKSKQSKPLPNQPEYVRNEYGSDVISRLDSQALRAIARVAGGSYYDFKAGEPIFQMIREKNVSAVMEKMRKIDAKDYDEWFQIPLGLAILLLGLEPLLVRIRERKKKAVVGVPVAIPETLSVRAKAAAIAVLCILLLGLSETRANTGEVERAESLLSAGKKDEAVELMRKAAEKLPDDPYLSYNFGLTLVRSGRIEEAVSVFENVQALTTDKSLRAQAMLQLGNIHFQSAIDAKGGPSTVRALENALSNYETHLALQSSDAAKKNRVAAAQELEGVLLKIGAERTRAKTEKTLREAMQVYERAVELNEKNQPLLDKANELLANELLKNAAQLDKEADAAEAAKESVAGKPFRTMLERRESVLSKLQEAAGLQPDRADLQQAVKKQQEKMSDLLTRAAEEQTKELLNQERNFYSNNSLKDLQDAGGKLEQALSLNPDNKKAEGLKEKVDQSLVEAHLANGELALKHFRKKPPEDADGRLSDATSAVKSFSSALELDPENETAKKGLAEIQPQLADLHAAAGEQDLNSAESMLGEAAKGAKPAETAAEPAASSPLEGVSADTLRKTGALLEKSINNLNAAVGLDPNNAKHHESAAKAEGLMASLRDELAKQDAKAGKGEGAGQGAGNEPGGIGGEGEGAAGEGAGTSSLQSLSGLRGKSKSGGGDGGDSSRYWENFAKDW